MEAGIYDAPGHRPPDRDHIPDAGKKIGREIAEEIERLFEVKVNPDAIRKRASRSGTNVPHEENPTNTDGSDNLEKLEKTHGGARPGAGRKTKTPEADPIPPPPSPKPADNADRRPVPEPGSGSPGHRIDPARNLPRWPGGSPQILRRTFSTGWRLSGSCGMKG